MNEILINQSYQESYAEILRLMDTVIIFRCKPINKRDIVRFVQQHPMFESPVTAAIGDGSNDISMLLQADVSFGLDAPETKICSSISDFSITKFEDCKRLMLWHGRAFAFKAINLLIWSVFKNMLFCIPIVYFNTFTGYSAGTFLLGPQFILYNAMTFIALFAYLYLD